jgi:hypothetical protein
MQEPPAYVTVTDAAGRVLFRRRATPAEVEEAIQVAKAAEAQAAATLKRIAKKSEPPPAQAPPASSLPPTDEQTGEPHDPHVFGDDVEDVGPFDSPAEE